jgi:hypothetical protein
LVSINDGWNEAAAEHMPVIQGVVVDRKKSDARSAIGKPLAMEMYKVCLLANGTMREGDWYTELDLDIVSSTREDTKKE